MAVVMEKGQWQLPWAGVGGAVLPLAAELHFAITPVPDSCSLVDTTDSKLPTYLSN